MSEASFRCLVNRVFKSPRIQDSRGRKGGAIVSDMTLGNTDDKARPILKAEIHRNVETFADKSVEKQILQK